MQDTLQNIGLCLTILNLLALIGLYLTRPRTNQAPRPNTRKGN